MTWFKLFVLLQIKGISNMIFRKKAKSKLDRRRKLILAVKNDFFSGIGSAFALPGNYYSTNYPNSDKESMAADWRMVGNAIKYSITNLENENKENHELNEL